MENILCMSWFCGVLILCAWKVAGFLRRVIGCTVVPVFSNCTACRGILGPKVFVTNVGDCSMVTLPTLEQIGITGPCAALAGLIMWSKVPGLKLDKSLLHFSQCCNWSAEKWSQLINYNFLLSEHHKTIRFRNLTAFPGMKPLELYCSYLIIRKNAGWVSEFIK